MMNKIIYLYWDNVKIAKLTFIENKYWYQIIENNLNEAKQIGCPEELIRNAFKKEKNIVSDYLPIIFSEFKISDKRIDLIEKLGILESDNEFEKLYKLSSYSDEVLKQGFWISNK